MMWWGGSWSPWDMVAGMLMMLVFWGVVVFGVVYAVRAITGGRGPDRRAASSAKAVLDERFARGEIDENEYHARRDALAS